VCPVVSMGSPDPETPRRVADEGTCVKCGKAISRGETFLYGNTGERYHLLCFLRVEEQVDRISRFARDHPGISLCYDCLASRLGLFPATVEVAVWLLLKSRGQRITTAACSGCLVTKPVIGNDPHA
jgi:hypothetical protein